jgi:hypothetical protein
MASKIKVDQIQTIDGSGTIALQNQLSGMTGASMPTGSVLQVVNSKYNGTTSLNSVDNYNNGLIHSDLTLSITPSSTSSKILLMYTVQASLVGTGGHVAMIGCFRGSTQIDGGTAPDDRQSGSSQMIGKYTNAVGTLSSHILDSPSTTSAITYSIKMVCEGVTHINRSAADADAWYTGRYHSGITAIEIAG